MHHTQFRIGVDFWCNGKRWRCTDIGSRVVVAISLEPHEVASFQVDPQDSTKRKERRHVTDDQSWFDGPPYGIVEHVFDEDSFIACSLERDDHHALFSLQDLRALLQRTEADVERYFKQLHHFSQHPPFKTRPSTFQIFSEYCEAQQEGIEAGGENERTIQRTYAFFRFLRSRTPEESLALAWKFFPLAKVYEQA